MARLLGLEPAAQPSAEVLDEFTRRYPLAQVVRPEPGLPYALMRVHTVTLTSSPAALCIDQRPIEGHTNEIGAMPRLLDELQAAYGRTRLYQVITTDAGNTSQAVAEQIVGQGLDYYCQIKVGQGEVHYEACDQLCHLDEAAAVASDHDKHTGQVVTYHLWRHDLGEQGWLGWPSARQLLRVQRSTYDPATGECGQGNRYYATSLGLEALSAPAALRLGRDHWRCENCTHWTADAELAEDRRQLAWSRHPQGALNASLLSRIALAILSITRFLSRLLYTEDRPTWAQVAEHYLLTLCTSALDTQGFDDV